MDNERIFLGLIASLFLIMTCLKICLEKIRTKHLRTLAENLNYTFSEKDKDRLLSLLDQFHLFSQGRSGKIRNVLQKKSHEIVVFDYQYTIRRGKGSQTKKQTVLLFSSPDFILPPFTIRPRNVIQKLKDIITFQKPIDFETYPAFSSRYHVRSKDETDMRRLLNPPLLSFYGQRPGLTTEGRGKQLIVYIPFHRVPPDKLNLFIDQGIELFELFKLGDKRKESLLTALEDPKTTVRRNAAKALGLFQDASVLPALRKAVADPEPAVRKATVWTLVVLRDACVIELLLAALQDSSGEVRQEAEGALRKVCPWVAVVVFGKGTNHHEIERENTIWNPDVSHLTFPMRGLKRIIIETSHHNFHSIERFMTYAIGTIGQRHLRKKVSVHLYGKPEELQLNLLNNLNNLCRHVYTHKETDTAIETT